MIFVLRKLSVTKEGFPQIDKANPMRKKLLKKSLKRIETDGINNAKYKLTKIVKLNIAIFIHVYYDDDNNNKN